MKPIIEFLGEPSRNPYILRLNSGRTGSWKANLAFFCCLFFICFPAAAVVEFHDFKQPEQEQAYQILISELRCLVCQNQTIADSNADLAKDLRRQVYEMLQQGQSKQQIVEFMTQRYGDFVMYKPGFKLKTALLWLGPLLFLLTGLIAVTMIVRRQKNAVEKSSLSADQQARLNAILEKGDLD